MSRKQKSFAIGIVLAACAWLGYWLLIHDTRNSPLPMSFDGRSDGLQETVIVPTLDSPIPPGKSAIWCASFQIAWNQLKDKVAEGPIQIENAQPIADRLNASSVSEKDLPPRGFYANAGWMENDIVATIQRDMERRFPHVPKPAFDVPQGNESLVAVAYAYLESAMKFDLPYVDQDRGMAFRDSSNRQTTVAAFGIPSHDHSIPPEMRKQVKVLFHTPLRDDDVRDHRAEFVVDPSGASESTRVILAMVSPRSSLAAMVADVREKTKASSESSLGSASAMLIPNMNWRVRHSFSELVGPDKRLLNPKFRERNAFVAAADQMIHFNLDRSGVTLRSEALAAAAKSQPQPDYLFNRPFLVLLQLRNADHPFFAMWVANAELLVPKR